MGLKFRNSGKGEAAKGLPYVTAGSGGRQAWEGVGYGRDATNGSLGNRWRSSSGTTGVSDMAGLWWDADRQLVPGHVSASVPDHACAQQRRGLAPGFRLVWNSPKSYEIC